MVEPIFKNYLASIKPHVMAELERRKKELDDIETKGTISQQIKSNVVTLEVKNGTLKRR